MYSVTNEVGSLAAETRATRAGGAIEAGAEVALTKMNVRPVEAGGAHVETIEIAGDGRSTARKDTIEVGGMGKGGSLVQRMV